MSDFALLCIRKPGDHEHIPTFSGTVPLEVAKWIERLAAENLALNKKLWGMNP
jgi:hypothetical protein